MPGPDAHPDQPAVALEPLPRGWESLPRAFLRTARANWGREAMADSAKTSLTYGAALTRASVLARVLRRELGDEPYVGLLVPPSVPGAVANIALQLLGKIPINLNYSASMAVIQKAIDRCAIRQIVTSRRFLEKIKLSPQETLIHLEDIPERVRFTDKVWGASVARVLPEAVLGSFLPGLRGESLSRTATVMFTSGSTGDPKGVVLTHGNILSNVHQMRQHLQLDPIPVVGLGVLPFFHSFGFTVGIWTILLLGKKAVYHNNPLDAKVVADLIEKHGVTLVAASPTFFRHYIQRGKPEQFRTLFHILLGAEKLKDEAAEAIQSAIGVDPLQGYGTTEMAPVASVNVPFEVTLPDGRRVPGNRRGTVGRLLPGTTARATDPESGATLPAGAEGMIHIRGPQIMAGYLDNPEATAKVLQEGWYSSGDLGMVDAEGFLRITGRLSRFSKIAGEMVPHEGVEAALAAAAEVDDRTLVVTSLPDAKRGERLAVLHTTWPLAPAEVCRKLVAGPLPKLWVPASEDFFEVPEIPLLGTGKVDLRRVHDLAQQLSQKTTGA